MGIKKTINRFMAEPKEMRTGEVIAVLGFYGYRIARINGSHHIFDKSGTGIIVIPVHNGKVTRNYIKYLKAVILKS